MHGFERQRFQNDHVRSALNEITRLFGHKRAPPEDQEEEYALPSDCQEERHDIPAWLGKDGELVG